MDGENLIEVGTLDEAMLSRIGELRVRCWATEIPDALEMGSWTDEYDPVARHWIVVRGDVLVASARLSMHESIDRLPDHDSYEGVFCEAPLAPTASFNRLVVAPRFRGLGLSRRLDIVRLNAAEETGCRSAVVATPTGEERVRQLKSLGFVVVGHTSGFAGGPFAFRPIVSEAILVCSLPRSLSGASTT